MFSEFKEKFETVDRMSCKPNFTLLRKDSVIDENKSVKWNKEQVEKNRLEYAEEVKRLNREKNTARDAVMQELYCVIEDELVKPLDRNAIRAIWLYAYEQSHSWGYNETFNTLERLIELTNDILVGIKRKK